MKTLVNNLLVIVICIIASTVCASSQTRSKEHSLSPFEGIEASDGFRVSITNGNTYNVKLTMNDALESYVECYVKGGVLHLGLDSKKVPKDFKKLFKGKNSPELTLIAIVTMPVLKSLTLNDESEFYSASDLAVGDLAITMSGSSEVNNLKIFGKSLELNVAKNARFTNASVKMENDVKVTTDVKGGVTMECDAANIKITGGGSSEINIKGSVDENIAVSTTGSSKITLAGKAKAIEVGGKATSSKVDASALEVETAVMSIIGVDVDVWSSKSLELDLGKGSEVTFAGDPLIKIIKIQSASVLRK
ncbi:MAG: DUF2807 domain-containing protein [Bacteroidales bacterium]|nr:DUF2807 domain-containing protein [Bacteroidales bacterium]